MIILNSSDKELRAYAAPGEGTPDLYQQLKKAYPGSTYLDRLNKGFYVKMDTTGKAADWKRLAGAAPTKTAVTATSISVNTLGKTASMFQENVQIGLDDKVRGKLIHTVWPEFSSNPAHQQGHYVSLTIPLPEGYTKAQFKKTGKEFKDMTDDGIIILIMEEGTTDCTIEVTTADGELTRTLDLTELVKA